MLCYFLEKSKIVQPSTLCSMLIISINTHLDLSKNSNLIAFLDLQSEEYRAEKSKSFTKQDIEKFLKSVNDEDRLMQKIWAFF
mgnify:FL=1